MVQAIFRPIGLNTVKNATILKPYVIGVSMHKAATIGLKKGQAETSGECCFHPAEQESRGLSGGFA